MDMGSSFTDTRRYIDVRLEETKLKAADGIASIVSQIAAFLIISVLAVVVIGFLAVVEMQYLNDCLGKPFGTLIAAGTLVLIIVIFYLLRQRLFAATLSRGICRSLGLRTGNVKKDLSAVQADRVAIEKKLDDDKFKLISSAIKGTALAIAVIRRLRK